MRQAMTVAMTALVTTFGGVVGTQIGRDAVSEIDPRFFSEVQQPVPYLESAEATRPAQSETMPAGGYYDIPGRRICWGCPAQPDTYVEAYVPQFDDPERIAIPTAGKAVVRVVEEERAPLTGGTRPASIVDRYMTYPVTKEEADRLSHMAELQALPGAPGDLSAAPQPQEM